MANDIKAWRGAVEPGEPGSGNELKLWRGAVEPLEDTGPPVLTLITFEEGTDGPTEGRVSFTANKAGTYDIYISTNASELESTIAANAQASGSFVSGANVVDNITGVIPGTAMYAHIRAEDAALNVVVESDGPLTTSPYTESAAFDGNTILPDSILMLFGGGIGDQHDGGDNVAYLEDSSANFPVGELPGEILFNSSDISKSVVTTNTAIRITPTTVGDVLPGTENDFDNGDQYEVHPGQNGLPIALNDVMYCEDRVDVLAGSFTVKWYWLDNSASSYSRMYVLSGTDGGLTDGSYNVSISVKGILTLTPVGAVPVLTNPTADAPTLSTYTGTVTTDSSTGTLYHLVSLNPVEGAAAIKAANSQPVTVSGVQNVSGGGLQLSNTYYIHYLHENSEGDSNIEVSPPISTFPAPTLTNPLATPTGTTTADGDITTDQGGGSLYWVISQDSGIPSPTQMRAGQDANGVPGEGNTGSGALPSVANTYVVPLTGLAAGTSYYVSYFQENSNGDSNVVRSPQFTTFFDIALLTLPTANAVNVTLNGTVTTDQGGGTLYYLATQSPTATPAEIKAGRSRAVTAAGLQSVAWAGLSPNTLYYMHYIQETSGDSNQVVASDTTGELPPASQLNDAILIATGGPTINDGLAAWFGKTANESLNDAERRWLISEGATPGDVNDMWFEYTGGLGLTGALNDRLFQYWIAGGASGGIGFFNMFAFGTCMESQGWTIVDISANSITINGLAGNTTLTRTELTTCGFGALPAPVFNDVLTCVQAQGFCLATPFK